MTPRQAYLDGLKRYTVKDHGRLSASHVRLSLLDNGRALERASWHKVYRHRRLLAAIHAAELLDCLHYLDTSMRNSPIDITWITRLGAAKREADAVGQQ